MHNTTKIDNNCLKLNKEIVNLREIILEVLNDTQIQIEGKTKH